MNDERQRGPDPVVDSDRLTGSTPPESGAAGSNVVGRPPGKRTGDAFHQQSDSVGQEQRPVSEDAALEESGSFDAVAPPQAKPE